MKTKQQQVFEYRMAKIKHLDDMSSEDLGKDGANKVLDDLGLINDDASEEYDKLATALTADMESHN